MEALQKLALFSCEDMGHFSETICFLFAHNSHNHCSPVSLSYWRLEKPHEEMFYEGASGTF